MQRYELFLIYINFSRRLLKNVKKRIEIIVVIDLIDMIELMYGNRVFFADLGKMCIFVGANMGDCLLLCIDNKYITCILPCGPQGSYAMYCNKHV